MIPPEKIQGRGAHFLWVALVGLVVLFGLASGCGMLPVSTPFTERSFRSADYDDLWAQTLLVIGREYSVRTSDKSSGIFTTSWDVNLQPFRYEGTRRRVEGKIDRSRERVTVGLKVRVDLNRDIDSPLNLADAEWKRSSDDLLEAERLLHLIARGVGKPSAGVRE